MKLTNFADIVTLTKQRVNYTDVDDTVDSVIKSGINQAYMEIVKNYEPRMTSTTIDISDGIIELPEDIMDVVHIEPPLVGNYKKIGNSILTQLSGAATVTYTYVPDPLVSDTDIPVITQKYWYLLTSFGAYTYYMYKKKEAEASIYMTEYRTLIETFRQKDKLSMNRRSYYADLLGGGLDGKLYNS